MGNKGSRDVPIGLYFLSRNKQLFNLIQGLKNSKPRPLLQEQEICCTEEESCVNTDTPIVIIVGNDDTDWYQTIQAKKHDKVLTVQFTQNPNSGSTIVKTLRGTQYIQVFHNHETHQKRFWDIVERFLNSSIPVEAPPTKISCVFNFKNALLTNLIMDQLKFAELKFNLNITTNNSTVERGVPTIFFIENKERILEDCDKEEMLKQDKNVQQLAIVIYNIQIGKPPKESSFKIGDRNLPQASLGVKGLGVKISWADNMKEKLLKIISDFAQSL